MKGKLYLVTGGTGFLGYHLIRKLLDEGALIRVIARKPSEELEKLGNVEYFKGSITDRDAILEAAQGVSGIFHLAGLVYHTRQPHMVQEMWETNVVGTMNVMRAAKAAKCRVVYASSSGTVGCSRRRGYVANDNAPYCDDIAQHWPYYKSKIESEIQAMEYARNHDLELMIMRPSMMLGPDDFYLRATKLVWNFLERKIPFIPLGGVSFVDVRDAAEAFKAAMLVSRPNSTYLLGSKNCSIEDLFIILESISGVAKPRLKLPAVVAKAAALALDTTNRKLLNKWDPGVDPVRVEMANHFWNIDWSKAMRELKFKPRSFEKTLADTINWLRDAKAKGIVQDHGAHSLHGPSASSASSVSDSSDDAKESSSEESVDATSPPAAREAPQLKSKL